jgi:energy-coupling factor transporter ATP-binding protein EcfA2
MSDPVLTSGGGIYTLTWHEEQVLIKMDRLREDSRHTVSAELIVKTTVPGTPQHLHQARLNLVSTQSRHTVARYLSQRLSELDWDAMIESACARVLSRYREGEPVVPISAIPVPESMEYRLDPILPDNESTLIYGEGGIGKSLIAAMFATLIQESIPDFGLSPEPGKVLYLDYETSSVGAARRFDSIHKGWDLDHRSEVLYRFCFQPLASEVMEIARIVAENGVVLVIIDSAGPACGGEPETASAAIGYFTALRSLRIASLTIAHKSKTTGGSGPFGSVYWTNYPRSVYEIKKSQTEGANQIHVGLFHKKVNDGALQKPRGFKLTFFPEDDAITMAKEDLRDVSELVKELSISDRIELALQGGAMSVKNLAQELDEKDGSIRVALNRHKANLFTKLSDDQWGLMARDS